MEVNGKKFKNIYNHIPRPAMISPDSEVKQDESLTISQIISLHLRGIPAPVHIYDGVEYEIGDNEYKDEQLNEDYYELESDLSDFNIFTDSSNDIRDDNVSSVNQQSAQTGDVFLDDKGNDSSSMESAPSDQ